MPRRKDPEITQYTLKNGQTYFRLKTYVGTNPETGKPVKVTRSKLKSRKEAELLRNQLKAQGPAAISNKLEIKKGRKTVAEVYAVWLENMKLEVRGSTINNHQDIWKNHTEPEFGNNFIDNILPDHIQKYVNDLAAEYISYKRIINQLQRLISYAKFRHWCDENPFDYVLIPKKSAKVGRDTSNNFYELDELKQFLEVAKAYSIKKYTYFLTVASLGCRRGEALALKWSDIDFERKAVMIQRTVAKDENGHKTIDDVKNGVHHLVPMSDNLYQVLIDYKQDCENKGINYEWVFPNSLGSYNWAPAPGIWIRSLYNFDEKRCQKWNAEHPDDPKKPLRRITPHGLRHTLATLLYDGKENITPKDVQFILGHRTSKTAMEIYTHVTEKQKKDIKGSINNLDF
ncbi:MULTISPECIES: site-specific integrase [Lactobacillus]|uniref:Site-specific integrase n=1 Tax=Lactobacillus xujianguonis TaxID=2495899 RepID=A0A437SUY3_9LACO|nr:MULTISPECIES: site-specific integrase [Lactobacillus]RVU70736.1 site-specific integrase [Lactobacillus xujianguonis]RVU72054.1 site-specific integrase [Lactobacillus xujianguonis]